MKVNRDKTENSQVFLTIEMEPAEVEAELEKSYHRLARKTNIPGFRKGKAPREVLERHIGKESLFDDALRYLLPQAYENAIKEQDIEVFAQPQLEIVQTDPVVFKATVPIKPTVELGDYHNVRVTPETVEVTEDDVTAAMEHLRHQLATWEPVEREVGFGDLVVLDVQSNIEDKPFISQQGGQFQVLQGSVGPVPGFAEQLVGLKREEDKEFTLQFPADYPRSEMAGKEAAFKVKISEIKQEQLPELNDEFARQIDPETETLDSLREKVSTDMRLGAEEKTRQDFEEQVVDAVVEQANLDFPPVLVEMEIHRFLDEQAREWQMRGGLEEYLSRINKTEEELREEVRPSAVKRVSRSLVLGKVAEEEKIEVSESKINDEIEKLTSGSAENKDKLSELFNTSQSRESIERWLTTRKTVQRLVEIAKAPAGKEK